MRVCYFGTYREEYSRNQIMIAGLKLANVDVIECQVQLWSGIQDRITAITGGWRKPKFWLRVLMTYIRLLCKYLHIKDFDVMIIGYPGQFDIFLAKLLCTLRHRPLVWDVFMSIYLISQERALGQEDPFSIRMLYRVEKAGLRLPDLLIQDTAQYVQWFTQTYQISADRFVLVPTGADDRIFHTQNKSPMSEVQSTTDDVCHVIYYGTFIPNHGVITIIEAARLLQKSNVIFTLIGDGPDKPAAQQLTSQFNLKNVNFIHWMNKPELIKKVETADIYLGAFGKTPQSMMTVQNKIFEGMAMQKPVITGVSEAVREFFQHEHSIYLCERQNSLSLAEAIQTLVNDRQLRNKIAKNGYKKFCEQFTVKALGEKFRIHLENVILSSQ